MRLDGEREREVSDDVALHRPQLVQAPPELEVDEPEVAEFDGLRGDVLQQDRVEVRGDVVALEERLAQDPARELEPAAPVLDRRLQPLVVLEHVRQRVVLRIPFAGVFFSSRRPRISLEFLLGGSPHLSPRDLSRMEPRLSRRRPPSGGASRRLPTTPATVPEEAERDVAEARAHDPEELAGRPARVEPRLPREGHEEGLAPPLGRQFAEERVPSPESVVKPPPISHRSESFALILCSSRHEISRRDQNLSPHRSSSGSS